MLSYIKSFFPFEKQKGFYYLSLLKESNGWSIHGLWPQTTETEYPTYCRTVEFDIKKLDSIIDELNRFWYSTEEKNEEFWKHEWQKHGSCMYNKCDEFYYFDKALQLYNDAILEQLQDKFYDEKTGKCLIPVDLNFKFIKNPPFTMACSDNTQK